LQLDRRTVKAKVDAALLSESEAASQSAPQVDDNEV
jgi:hypothetical protein